MPNRPEYQAWRDMNRRCYDPRTSMYYRYGGRGISVCDDWRHSFKSFYEHMGARPDGHSLERIDGDGNYEPGNVKWATRLSQNANRCSVIRIEFDKRSMTMREWASELGIHYDSLRYRIQYAKWPLERALSRDRWISDAVIASAERGRAGIIKYWQSMDKEARSRRSKAAYANRGRV